MAFFEFPHTRTYDSDLGWIIKRINEQQDQMDDQAVYMAELKAWMDENEPRIEHIEEIYDLFEHGQLPTAVQAALTEWLEEYGVLDEAKAYTDEKTENLSAALADEVLTRTTQNASMQSQIDELIAPTGTAPNPAEVTDARIGYDGTVYNTLGDAIRTQITGARTFTANTKKIADALAQKVACEGRVMYATTHDYYWDVSGATAVLTAFTPSGSNWYASDKIPVTVGDIYRIYNTQGGSHKTRIWTIIDGNDNIIANAEEYYSLTNEMVSDAFAVPPGGEYLIFTTNAGSGESAYIRHLYYSPAIKDMPMQVATEKSWYWNIEQGKAIKTFFSGSNYRAAMPIPVKEGEKYAVTAAQGGTNRARIWTACDDQLNIVGMAANYPNATVRTLRFTIPAGATRLILCGFAPDSDSPYITLIREQETVYDYIAENSLRGRTVAIIGDSISTNGSSGALSNVPEMTITSDDIGVPLSAYLTYYDVQAGLTLGGHTFTSAEIGTEVSFTPLSEDLGKVIGLSDNYNPSSRITWWEVAMNELGFNPIPVCWSGASITSHEGSTPQYMTSYAWHPAQIRKCGIRIPGTMTRTAPDVIIIYRGVNDFSHSPYTKITDGYFDGSWTYPADDAVTGGYGYLEGIACTIKALRTAYPNAQIVLCTLNTFKRVNVSAFPVNNGENTLPEYNDAIRKAADFFGCITIDLDRDGITFENCYSGGYITDSSTYPTHPNDTGHMVMGRKAIADLKAKLNPMY